MFINEDFPKIECLNDILPHIQHLPEIRLIQHENGIQTLCYMISGSNTFSGESAKWARECRGISFYADGKIASRSMQKFFNVNERESTQKNVLPWNDVVRIMDKRDGSMITPVLVNDELLLKSKKSFTSDVANMANEYIKTRPNVVKFCREMLKEGFTPTFEFTSPQARIVLNYKADALVLLHIRNTVSGSYVDSTNLKIWAQQFYIPAVDEYMYSSDMSYFFDSCENDKDIEGYVIQFRSGDMVKLKTQWYLELHRNCVFLNERDIAEMVLNETLDDYKSYLNETESDISIKRVQEIETEVCNSIVKLEHQTNELYLDNSHLSKKDFAMKLKNEPLFHLAMRIYDGKSCDIREYYRKQILKTVFNSTQV